MTNLVDRLREFACKSAGCEWMDHHIAKEAANELVQLRTNLRLADKEVETILADNVRLQFEIAELRRWQLEARKLMQGGPSPDEPSVLQPGEDIAEALEGRGDTLSVRAARHIRIKWNTEEGLRQQLRSTNGKLNELPVKSSDALRTADDPLKSKADVQCPKCGATHPPASTGWYHSCAVRT